MSSNFSKGPFCDYIKDYIKNPSELPDDPEVLKEIIVSQQSITDKLFEQIKLLRLMIYGRKSEKFSDRDHNQGFLFAEQVTEEIADRQIKKDTKIKEHIRRSSNLRKLPDGTPVIEIIHDINEDKKQCGCGAQLVRIGEEKTDRVDIIPARVIAERHIRPKYACPSCEGSGDENRPAVLIAPLPAQLIPKSPVTEGFLAHIMVSKFSDHLPFHRIQKILARMKMNISKSTMCDWAIYISERLQTVYELLRDELMRSECIGCDETTLQILREPNQRNTKKSYNWTFCGIANNKPVILMYYQESRRGQAELGFCKA